jgi:ABC-type lipoprotein release transport system permease subunit
MRLATLCRRNLTHHGRIGLAVLLGAAAGTAVLTGALLVGDSMRGSLRERALERLAGVEYAVIGGRYFREELAAEIEEHAGRASPAAAGEVLPTICASSDTEVGRYSAEGADGVVAAPVILLRGVATHAETRARVGRVAVIGSDERLLKIAHRLEAGATGEGLEAAAMKNRLEADTTSALVRLDHDGVILNEPLARELGVVAGADVLLRLGRPGEVSPETLMGRRENGVVTMRLTVRAVIPARGLGGFSLEPATAEALNAFVTLRALQRALGQPRRASAILLSGPGRAADRPATARAGGDRGDSLRSALKSRITLEDYGLRVRIEPRYGYFALESSAMLLEPPAAEAARTVARQQGLSVNAVLAHLANRIERVAEHGEPQVQGIPYSTVAAVSDASELTLVQGGPAAVVPGEILLNEWAAEQLGASPGDRIRLTYYVTAQFGRLETQRREFRLAGVVSLERPPVPKDQRLPADNGPRPPTAAQTSDVDVGRYWSSATEGRRYWSSATEGRRYWSLATEGRRDWGTGADRGWVPEYRGITDTQTIADWDPPFPVDFNAIRPIDEQYWDEFRAAPKAFIALEEGQGLWSREARRLGDLTSLRLRPAVSALLKEQRSVCHCCVSSAVVRAAVAGSKALLTEQRHICTVAAELRVGRVEGSGFRVQGSVAARPSSAGFGGQSPPSEAAREFESALRAALDPERMGIRVEDVTRRAEAAARGTTDFGALFVGLSLFLIASAAMLVALLFRLGVERRAREIGLLLATGYPQRTVRRLLLTEGALIAAGGAVLGLALALGYAALMLKALSSQWPEAVGTPFLRLHVTSTSVATGTTTSMAIALGSIAFALRGVARRSPRALLAGAADGGINVARPPSAGFGGQSSPYDAAADLRGGRAEGSGFRVQGSGRPRSPLAARLIFVVACAAAIALVGLSALTGVVPQTAAFFGGGASLLVGLLARLRIWLVLPPGGLVHRPGALSIVRLGVRNARRNAGRSLLAAGVLACAAFLITSMEALRLQPAAQAQGRRSGTGGFALIAEAVTPLLFDLNTTAGRESLGLSDEAAAALRGAQFVPLRLRPGDETSCLSLYQAGRPRIVGAPEALIARGGFEFVSSLAETPEQQENPWLLLRRRFADGAVAAIGDEATVVWQLHSGLGREVEIVDERGQQQRLRFVALLRGSVLQNELIVAEMRFVELFPSVAGYCFFLIQVPQARVAEAQAALERGLERFGFDAQPSLERLRAYFAVQNTYLSAFQTLGGLGLVLGALGLTAVVLRSIWERRGELALLRALGWSRVHIGGLLLAEQGALVVMGLIIGVAPALLALAPRLAQAPAEASWLSLAGLLAGVLVASLGVAAVALAASLRAALLPALRSE